MPWTVRTRQDSPWPVQIVDEFGEVTALMASDARALAAELVRAADEVEPGTEAGYHDCPNCRWPRYFTPVLTSARGYTGTLSCGLCGCVIEAPKENAHV